ncbi:hypothetical protein JVT61DRAFT_13351 [Boletus reticuloceps]|uniref:DUF8190 domain-containing protein n=1 Tax=Boletus reticuloceps TaxID=495285 RepID=A0A8I2YDG4_9AGAM|nr:hypothetical protein JVT61DRAFT_13351 [Boletus reticuloceps]
MTQAYVFKLDLNKRQKQWQARHADLEFDPMGRMLFIGTYGQEEIWLAMVPRWFNEDDLLDDGNPPVDMAHPDRTGPNATTITEQQYCQVVVFFATQLKHLGFRDIILRDDFPSPLGISNIRDSTNILGSTRTDRIVHEMRRRDVEALHEAIEENWDRWVYTATTSGVDGWDGCTFLKENVPMGISVRYGQNQPVCGHDEDVRMEEAHHWQRLHKYTHMRMMTFALATHIQSVPVREWQDIPIYELIERHGQEMYNSPNVNEREQVHIQAYPLLEESGREKNIYNQEGVRIPRRHAIVDEDATMNGMLFNLRTIHQLFRRDDEDIVEDSNGDEPLTPHYLYPMAGLKTIGHFQALGLMTPFITQLQRLNTNIRDLYHDGDEDEIEADLLTGYRPLIEAVASQGYNMLSHRVRTAGRYHDVQRGLITAALGGTYPSTVSNSNLAKEFHRECSNSYLSIHTMRRSPVHISTRLPGSKTYIEYHSDASLNASEMADIWSNGQVLEELKRHLVIFRPKMLPSVFEWTTFGLTSALRIIWDKYKNRPAEESGISPYWVELTAALERSLNYMHTGNAKVLTRGLMDPLWLSLSLVNDGLPCLSPVISLPRTSLSQLDIRFVDWPVRKGEPMVASKKSHMFNYGLDHFQSYHGSFLIKHALLNVPEEFHASLPITSRLILFAFHKAFKIYITDIVVMVGNVVGDELNVSLCDDDPVIQAQAKERRTALALWKKQDHPLAYANNAHRQLIRTIHANNDNLGQGLPAAAMGQKSLTWFADQIIQSATQKGARILPPFWKHGRALSIFKVVINEAQRLLGSTLDDPATRSSICSFLSKAALLSKVSNIPWSPDPTGIAGRPMTIVTHSVWINLGQSMGSDCVAQRDHQSDDLDRATQNAIMNDTQAEWSLLSISLQDIHTIWNKQTLPEEWTQLDSMTWPNTADGTYVQQTYNWVRDNYDGSIPLHKLALVMSIIFSKVLPNPIPQISCDLYLGCLLRRAVAKG